MAISKLSLFSYSLQRVTDVMVFIPINIDLNITNNNKNYERETKSLYMLHGYSGSYEDYFYFSSIIELASQYNLAVICPSGDNSFYLDEDASGRNYLTYVGKELVEFMQKNYNLSSKIEDNFIGGISMGGFGAIHTALQFNHTFSKTFGLSPALIIHSIKNLKEGESDEIANYNYYKTVFGDLENVVSSTNNPETLVTKIKDTNDVMPNILFGIGTEDFLYETNQIFRKFLMDNDVEHTYFESKGIHDWKFWNEYMGKAISWLIK